MLNPRGYREEELVSNRASLLLYGGTEEERRLWAREAAQHFAHEGGLVEVRRAAELAEALRRPRGVVLVTDVASLGREAQGQLVRCLRTQEERPKLVLGLAGSVEGALERGALREDLHYQLLRAQVDLEAPGLREVLRPRWEALAALLEAQEAAAREAAEQERQAALVRRPGTVTRLTPQQRKAAAAKGPARKAGRR